MLDQAFYAAQTRGTNENFRFRRDRHGRVASVRHFKRKHPAEQRHLFRRDLVTGMRLQSRIMETSYFRVSGEKVRNFDGVLRVRPQTPRRRAYAAQNEPAIKMSGDGASTVVIAADERD